MTGWFDQLFSLFNFFALLLVLCICVYELIFFFDSKTKRISSDKQVFSSVAVYISALTTLLVFDLLAVSSTEIVNAFGFTVAKSILMALLLSPLVGIRRYGKILDL